MKLLHHLVEIIVIIIALSGLSALACIAVNHFSIGLEWKYNWWCNCCQLGRLVAKQTRHD